MLRFPYSRRTLNRPSPTLRGGRERYLPIVAVSVKGPLSSAAVDARVDSGSDDTILPLRVATQIGLDLTNAPEWECEAVGGAVIPYRCAAVRLRISDGKEAFLWEAIVGFLDTPRKTGLIGLAGFLEYFETRLLGDLRETQFDICGAFPGQHIVR